jgi:DNA-binding transcriptional regulator LsrR (DeoR family)
MMATLQDNTRLFYKVAKAYYEDGLTYEQIGSRLGFSRMKVARLLEQARAEKIVQIVITPPNHLNTDFERKLEAHYGLDEAVVVTTASYDHPSVLQQLGPAAAECLLRGLQGHEIVNLTWGTAILAVVDALPRQNWPELTVVQMLGGLGSPEADVHATDLTRRAAQSLGAKPRLLSAPGIVSSKLVRDALLADRQISDTLALAAKADAALVGIGRPTPSSVVVQSGILNEKELDQLHHLGAVGDIGLRFFDAGGQAIHHEICDRIIGLDLDQLIRIPRVVGVAGSNEKFEVIRAALRGKLLNVLVTDDRTAARLLKKEAPPHRDTNNEFVRTAG